MKHQTVKFVDSGTVRVYVFIDASNLWEAQKVKGKFLNYEKTMSYISQRFQASELKVFYYTAYPADGTRSYDVEGKHRFFTFLKKGLGFVVRKKPLKQIRAIADSGEYVQEKGNMDVEMTIDVLHCLGMYDLAIFFTGDSDFLALVSYLQKQQKKVYIFSSKNNVSRELRTGGDGYMDVLALGEDIWGKNIKRRDQK